MHNAFVSGRLFMAFHGEWHGEKNGAWSLRGFLYVWHASLREVRGACAPVFGVTPVSNKNSFAQTSLRCGDYGTATLNKCIYLPVLCLGMAYRSGGEAKPHHPARQRRAVHDTWYGFIVA
jgi:hypothetical protein